MPKPPFHYKKITQTILAALSKKGRDILSRRFGLQGVPQTLQEIGDDYEITRERVRQIEETALKALRTNKTLLNEQRPLWDHFQEYFKEYGGLRQEQMLLRELGGGRFHSYVRFLLTIGEPFEQEVESNEFSAFWYTSPDAVEKARTIIAHIVTLFKQKNKAMPEGTLVQWCNDVLPGLCGESVSRKAFFSYLETTKLIGRNPFGEYGLVNFPEIRPRGVRDESYIVLARAGCPLHFEDVAKHVTKMRRELHRNRTAANAQTIHNELIKGDRFILVGRGLYALREWGYKSGIVREVIEDVLKEAGKPISKTDVVLAVKKQRFVKDNTIFLNLHNRKYFRRTPDGLFTLRT